LAAGLIDSILYRDQVLSMAFDGEGDKTNMMSMSSYIKATEPKESAATTAKKPKIGLVYATGTIVRGAGSQNSLEEQCASEKIAANLRSVYRDPSVKAIVMRIDSRGGSAVASDSIRRELEKARELGLPVVVSMGSYAASGGYYIATAADKIVAQPATITGSIGAFFWENGSAEALRSSRH